MVIELQELGREPVIRLEERSRSARLGGRREGRAPLMPVRYELQLTAKEVRLIMLLHGPLILQLLIRMFFRLANVDQASGSAPVRMFDDRYNSARSVKLLQAGVREPVSLLVPK